MVPRYNRFASPVFGVAFCLAIAAVIACGPRVGAGAGPATVSADDADADRALSDGETSDGEGSDSKASDGRDSASQAGASSKDRTDSVQDNDQDDVEPFAHSKAESSDSAEPERDAKGKKKLKAPEKTRSPSLNKPPAKTR